LLAFQQLIAVHPLTLCNGKNRDERKSLNFSVC